MEQNSPTTPCMGTLTLRVVVKMWNSLPADADCTVRKTVAGQISRILDSQPSGSTVMQQTLLFAQDKCTSCDAEEKQAWEYICNLLAPRLKTA